MILKLLRANHWIKNLIVFFPIFFGGELFNSEKLIPAAFAFLSFCLISSSGYIFNDSIDSEKDSLHPQKSKRPIASNAISRNLAVSISLLLFVSALIFSSFFINSKLTVVLLIYIANVILYSLYLKNIAYLDVILISLGFVLRLLGGGISASIVISGWLFSLTFITALMFAGGKRLEEIGELNLAFRTSLKRYNGKILTIITILLGLASVVLFCIYLVQKDRFNLVLVIVTILLVSNYLYSAIKKGCGEPTEFVLKNKINMILLLIWVVLFFKEIYA